MLLMQLRRHSRKPLLFLLSSLCLLVGGVSLSDFPLLGWRDERVLISAVSDGDTLGAADGRRIRLYGVDCPEKRQDRGSGAGRANRC